MASASPQGWVYGVSSVAFRKGPGRSQCCSNMINRDASSREWRRVAGRNAAVATRLIGRDASAREMGARRVAGHDPPRKTSLSLQERQPTFAASLRTACTAETLALPTLPTAFSSLRSTQALYCLRAWCSHAIGVLPQAREAAAESRA